MPQFARPSADVFIGSWSNQAGGLTNLYQSIDEPFPTDFDYVQSEQLLSNVSGDLSTILVVALGPITDPGIDTGFILRVRAGKDLVNGREIDLVVELRQDYMNEIDSGILIATLEIFFLTDTPTNYVLNLTSAQAAMITNFNTLSLRYRGRVGTGVP